MQGNATISNDGATILKLLDIVHPAARTLVDIARAQDAEVGDGTTSVVLLAGEILKEIKGFVEDGVGTWVIQRGLREGARLAVEKINEIAVAIDKSDPVCVPPSLANPRKAAGLTLILYCVSPNRQFRKHLLLLAATSMSSKLIHSQKPFFSEMVVDAVLCLDQEDLDENLIGIKKVPGGGMQDSLLVRGVAFKKTFSYAGFEQQPKSFKEPKVLCLNVELELKAEKDNAEVRVNEVSVRGRSELPEPIDIRS